jgi:polysaccharide chain length determinant protein (PEP-CTERM system associated)
MSTSIPLEQTVRNFLSDIFRYRNAAVAIFVVVNLVAVGLGLVWPKSYTSSTTIYIEEKNIIQPLMAGTAVATSSIDRSKIAREVIFSRSTMSKILEYGGWLDSKPSDLDQEKIIEALKARTKVLNVGSNLIRIEYSDQDPQRAFKTAQKFAELFVSESLGNQSQESQAAFEFIDSQVKEYHEKLTTAETGLKEFRSDNVDARPGTEAEIAGKINALQSTIERTMLEIKEAQIKQASLEKQLSGEAEVSASLTREGQYATRIAELQSQLEALRLNYHDTYPDVVRIRHQIDDLKEGLTVEQQQRDKAGKTTSGGSPAVADGSTRIDPLYQQLKRTLFETKTNIETLTTRLAETKQRLREEIGRAKRVHSGEAALSELTRDYEVNRDIYQDLLRRRENARVSKNLDRDKQGLTLRINEPAFVPIQPSGIRFFHFALGGILLGMLVPPGLLFGVIQVDPRVRFQSLISDKLRLPVLGTVPHLVSPAEEQAVVSNIRLLTSVVLVTLGFVATISFLKLVGAF